MRGLFPFTFSTFSFSINILFSFALVLVQGVKFGLFVFVFFLFVWCTGIYLIFTMARVWCVIHPQSILSKLRSCPGLPQEPLTSGHRVCLKIKMYQPGTLCRSSSQFSTFYTFHQVLRF